VQIDHWRHVALERALVASADVEDAHRRARVLVTIAEIQADTGDLEAARGTLREASSIIAAIEPMPLRPWIRHDVALAHMRIGDVDDALAAAEQIGDPSLRDGALASIALMQRDRLDFSGALEAAQRIRDRERRGTTLRQIASHQARLGALEKALSVARRIEDARAHQLALGDVAAAEAREGDIVDAHSLAARIRDPLLRARAYVRVAAARAETGDIAGALESADLVEDPLLHVEALVAVAAARARRGDREGGRRAFERALSLARESRASNERRLTTLVEIARLQIDAGEQLQAQRTLQEAYAGAGRVRDDRRRYALLGAVARQQARAGDASGALAIAGLDPNATSRSLLVRDIITIQAQSGDTSGALRNAMSLDEVNLRMSALLTLLDIQIAREDADVHRTIDGIARVMPEVESVQQRASALGALCLARTRSGELDAARTLCEEALNAARSGRTAGERAEAYAALAESLLRGAGA